MTGDNRTLERDSAELRDILHDILDGLEFVRQAQGFGEIVVKIQVRPQGIARWDVGHSFSRKPGSGCEK